MGVQIILCMETNKSAATDYVYIKDTINRFYICTNKTKITPLYMNSKSRYSSKDVVKEIQRLTKEYVIGETRVIYCSANGHDIFLIAVIRFIGLAFSPQMCYSLTKQDKIRQF